MEKLWNHGHAQTKRVYDVDSGELAKYTTKPLKEHEPEDLKRYHPSRNLIRKDPEKENGAWWTGRGYREIRNHQRDGRLFLVQ